MTATPPDFLSGYGFIQPMRALAMLPGHRAYSSPWALHNHHLHRRRLDDPDVGRTHVTVGARPLELERRSERHRHH